VFPANSHSGHIEEPKSFLVQIAVATGIVVSCHDLRRVYATAAESTDISPLALRQLLNHSLGDHDVTVGYIQMQPARLAEAAQRVANQLKVLCDIKPVAGVARLIK
jgi:integrase